jgi:hypothetical protein
LSTLDYAHRAKSIKNRPEVNWHTFLPFREPIFMSYSEKI